MLTSIFYQSWFQVKKKIGYQEGRLGGPHQPDKHVDLSNQALIYQG